MQTTVYQLASRVDPGSPMRRRRRQRMLKLNKNTQQRTPFAAHLSQAHRKTKQLTMMPPTVENRPGKTEQPAMMPPTLENKSGKTEQPPPMPSMEAKRTAYRRGFMRGFIHMRKIAPHMHQSQMGWVKARLSKALTNNPFMADKDIKALDESLVGGAPDYGIEE